MKLPHNYRMGLHIGAGVKVSHSDRLKRRPVRPAIEGTMDFFFFMFLLFSRQRNPFTSMALNPILGSLATLRFWDLSLSGERVSWAPGVKIIFPVSQPVQNHNLD